jgi:hypothetical protein
MTTTAIRTKLYDYIKVADEKKVKAIYTMLESEIETNVEWWLDEKVIFDIQKRVNDFEIGKDKGFSKSDILNEIQTLKVSK